MSRRLALTTLLVHDYDEAIAFYRDALGFRLVEDSNMGAGKRWVVMSPGQGEGGALLLARAVGEQADSVGRQAGGRVFLFLHTSDFAADHARMTAAGVKFVEAPRQETYGVVAVFEDLYGNRFDLIEPRAA